MNSFSLFCSPGIKKAFLYFAILLSFPLFSQSYTSYFTGHSTDTLSSPEGGVCMMGGASEHDEAMRWFLRRSQGGDVLVLRTSGANGYNSYLYSQLGVKVNSVETIVCNTADASFHPYVLDKIARAEAIWFAGGDQWDYISFWRNTPVDSLINLAIKERHIVIGGTSAGMAILGGFYFSAKNGTVTSAAALANPYTTRVTVDSSAFLEVPFLENVITDTHYDNPDRKGRQIAFLARMMTDWGVEAKGIACDEYTAVCVGADGIAHVYGAYPADDDNAWFIQVNCELEAKAPEQCSQNQPLIWNHNGTALKVCNIKGTNSGTNTFDLNHWTVTSGGSWQNWYVTNTTVNISSSDPIQCNPVNTFYPEPDVDEITLFPNPSYTGAVTVQYHQHVPDRVKMTCSNGIVITEEVKPGHGSTLLQPGNIPSGIYQVHLYYTDKVLTKKLIVY